MRHTATLSSFVIVLALYFVYGWGLVPLVLPNLVPPPRGLTGDKVISGIYDPTREEIAQLLELLPTDQWENDANHPIHVLQFNHTVLLFGKDTITGNSIELEPCTILLLPDDIDYRDPATKEQLQETTIFRVPDRTVVKFDRDFEIGLGKESPEIVGAQLFGKVTIEKGKGGSGKEDGFFLKTETVEITETPGLTKVETRKDVQFNLGFHSGVGTGLVLEMAQSDPNQRHSSKQLHSARFERLVSLRLVFPEDANATSAGNTDIATGNVSVPAGPATTIDAWCLGRFVFAVNPAEQGWTASFYQNVEMERTNPDKTVDRLTAEQVHLTLTPGKSKSGASILGDQTAQFDGLEPVLFVAHGKAGQGTQSPVPATLTTKQNGGITLVGDEIFLDLRKNFVSLSTRKGAGASPHVEMLLADQFKIRSEQSVQYTFGQDGAFGRFVSEGKGNLTGKTGEGASAKDVYLTWNTMQIAPHPTIKDQIVLKLGKGVTARMTGIGTMTARTLDLFCNVAPSTPASTNRSSSSLPGMDSQKNNLLLESAVVKEKVVLTTESGTCNVEQLTILFTHVLDGKVHHSHRSSQILTMSPPVAPRVRSLFAQHTEWDTVVPASASVGSHSQPIQQVQHLQSLQPLAPQQTPTVTTPAVTTPAPAYGSRAPRQPLSTPKSASGTVETQNLLGMKSSPNGGKYAITGDTMKMEVRLQDGQSSAQVVAVEGNVHLKETLAGTPAPNTAIEVTGNIVTIWNPSEPTTKITILGHPTGGDAVFKGKGVELETRELHISRPDNKFWSPGAGRMIAHTAQVSMPGMSAAKSDSPLTVEWNKEMVCDGLVLQFVGQSGPSDRVKTTYQKTQMLWCDVMEIWLNRRVMFFDDTSPIEPKALKIKCSGNVCARNEQFDVHGKPKSIDTAKGISNLHYDIEENYFIAEGPGEMNTIFLGSGQGFGSNNLAAAQAHQTQNSAENLTFLGIGFQHQMQGTLINNSKQVDIQGKVEVAYCPVTGWNDVIAREHFAAAARRTGYLLDCERLRIVEVPNPLNMSQSSMELTATTNAVIDGSGIFARAQNIMYNQAKGTVYMSNNVKLQKWGQAEISAEALMYNTESGSVDFIQTQGLGITGAQ